MSLVYQCLENFNVSDYGNQLSAEETAKYTADNGGFLISMESVVALDRIYDLDYEMECLCARCCAEAKSMGVPVEEGIGSALRKAKDKIGEMWKRTKDWFAKMRDKIHGWFENIKKSFREMFAKPKALVQDLDPGDYEVTSEGNDLVISESNAPASNVNPKSRPTNAWSGPGRKPGTTVDTRKRHGASRAVSLRIKDFKMYKYTNLEGFRDSIIQPIYVGALSKSTQIVDELYKEYKKNLGDFSGMSEIIGDPEYNRPGYREKKAVPDSLKGASRISSEKLSELTKNGEDTCKKYLGGTDKGEQVAYAFSYFRNGAKGESDKKTPDASTSRKLISEARSVLASDVHVKTCTSMQQVIDKHFNEVISQLNKWEAETRKYEEAGRLSAAISRLTGAYSSVQSGVNTMVNGWMTAVKERTAAYSQIISKVHQIKVLRKGK